MSSFRSSSSCHSSRSARSSSKQSSRFRSPIRSGRDTNNTQGGILRSPCKVSRQGFSPLPSPDKYSNYAKVDKFQDKPSMDQPNYYKSHILHRKTSYLASSDILDEIAPDIPKDDAKQFS